MAITAITRLNFRHGHILEAPIYQSAWYTFPISPKTFVKVQRPLLLNKKFRGRLVQDRTSSTKATPKPPKLNRRNWKCGVLFLFRIMFHNIQRKITRARTKQCYIFSTALSPSLWWFRGGNMRQIMNCSRGILWREGCLQASFNVCSVCFVPKYTWFLRKSWNFPFPSLVQFHAAFCALSNPRHI